MSAKGKRSAWHLFGEENPPDGEPIMVYIEADNGSYWMPEGAWDAKSRKLVNLTINPPSLRARRKSSGAGLAAIAVASPTKNAQACRRDEAQSHSRRR